MGEVKHTAEPWIVLPTGFCIGDENRFIDGLPCGVANFGMAANSPSECAANAKRVEAYSQAFHSVPDPAKLMEAFKAMRNAMRLTDAHDNGCATPIAKELFWLEGECSLSTFVQMTWEHALELMEEMQ